MCGDCGCERLILEQGEAEAGRATVIFADLECGHSMVWFDIEPETEPDNTFEEAARESAREDALLADAHRFDTENNPHAYDDPENDDSE